MTRGPHDTAPMRLLEEPARTDPGEPPSLSTSTDATDPGAWSPDVTPVTHSSKSPDNTTDPGLDPMLKAFNRPPRPPAPQPNLRPSSDGEEFAAHYASPRELRSPNVGPTAHDPAVLVQLAQLARTDTAPMADPTPDTALAVQREVQAATVVQGRKRIPVRILVIALAVGGLTTAFGAFFFLGPANTPTVAPSTRAESSSVQAPPPVASASFPSASTRSSSPSSIPTVTATPSTPPPPPPATAVRGALPTAAPFAPPASPRAAPVSSAPRPATSEHGKPAVPRPTHENPDTVL
jgi:hypothetical protein